MIRSVCDTGPLLHLTEAQELDTLRYVEEVHAPRQVIAELVYLLADWEKPNWLIVDALLDSRAAEAAAWLQAELLHAGEAEAIALALQIHADWFVTDDAAARLFAAEAGIEVHGSLGIILWAAAVGHYSRTEAERALARLAASSLWLSSRVLSEARAALAEIYQNR